MKKKNEIKFYIWLFIWSFAIFISMIKGLYFKGSLMYGIPLISYVASLLTYPGKSKKNINEIEMSFKELGLLALLFLAVFGLLIYFSSYFSDFENYVINEMKISLLTIRITESVLIIMVTGLYVYRKYVSKNS